MGRSCFPTRLCRRAGGLSYAAAAPLPSSSQVRRASMSIKKSIRPLHRQPLRQPPLENFCALCSNSVGTRLNAVDAHGCCPLMHVCSQAWLQMVGSSSMRPPAALRVNQRRVVNSVSSMEQLCGSRPASSSCFFFLQCSHARARTRLRRNSTMRGRRRCWTCLRGFRSCAAARSGRSQLGPRAVI